MRSRNLDWVDPPDKTTIRSAMPSATPLNVFDLRFVPGQLPYYPPGEDETSPRNYPQIWIDGAHLDEPHAIDLIELVESLYYPGEFTIFTCGCGVALCAYIEEGIFVRHERNRIYWGLHRPISVGGAEDEDYETWQSHAQWVEYSFDRESIRTNIADSLTRCRHDPDVGYSPHGFERSDLLTLNPFGPLAELPHAAWRGFGGRHLFVLADQDMALMIDGVFTGWEDINLSPSYLQRLSAWRANHQDMRCDTDKRQEWLGMLAALLQDAYQSGLAEDTTLTIIAQQWNIDGRLDPWRHEERTVQKPSPIQCRSY